MLYILSVKWLSGCSQVGDHENVPKIGPSHPVLRYHVLAELLMFFYTVCRAVDAVTSLMELQENCEKKHYFWLQKKIKNERYVILYIYENYINSAF